MLQRMRSILPLLIAVLILQCIPPLSASAAAGGPILLSTSPSDNDTAVPANARLQLVFDEPVQRGQGTIDIKEVNTNNTVDSLDVAANTAQVQFANPNTVVVTPTAGRIQANVDYYVTITPNAFVGASAGYAGIADATTWNFHTVAADTTPPQVLAYGPASGGTIAGTDALTLTFNERVSAAQGNIRIVRRDNQDTQTISVLSSAVSGSGTVDGNGYTVIRIQPPIRLNASATYDVLVDSGAFVDQVGNPFGGLNGAGQWWFQTAAPAVVVTGLNPANNQSTVDYNTLTALSLAFGSNMKLGAGKIYVKRISDNAAVDTIDVASGRVTVAANVVNVALASRLQAGTAYYVQIDPGALKDASDRIFEGYPDATSWRFTTAAAPDTTPPAVSWVSPANNGNTAALNSKLTIKFNKPVWPGSGTIVIRNLSNNSTLCSIDVTSNAVVGGGSDTITITPCANFALNSTYAIQISSRAFIDQAGNAYAGIGSNDTTSWRFAAAQDQTIPELAGTWPAPQANSVAQNAVLRMTFNEPVLVVPGSYGEAVLQTSSGSGAAIKLALAVDPSDAKSVTLSPVTVDPTTGAQTPAQFARASQYIVRVPEGAVTDLAGNRYPGIMNAYRWIFSTIGSDTTPPTLKSAAIDGSSVLLTFSEDMDGNSVPYASNFYVTVNDVPRQVNGIAISGTQVRLQLQSGVTLGQTVKVSYTVDTRPLQDLSGNKAAAFKNISVTNTADTTLPRPTSGTISGNVLTLTFNKALAAVPASAISQFTVKLGGSPVGISSLAISGQTATFVLYGSAANSLSASVSYTLGSNPLYDTSGNAVAAFADFYVQNANDTTPPQLTSGSVSGNKITLVFNEGLDPNSVPLKSSFSVMAGSAAATVSSVAISNNTVVLTLSQSVAQNQTVLVTYVPSAPQIKDLAGNIATVISNYPVTQGGASAVKLSSALVGGNTLVLTYSGNLSTATIPTIYQYNVLASGVTAAVTNVSVSGAKVTLTLSSQVSSAQSVILSYAPANNPLKDSSGLPVDAIVNYPVAYSDSVKTVGLPDYLDLDGAGGLLYKAAKASASSATTISGSGATRYDLDQQKTLDAYALYRAGGVSGLTLPQLTFAVPSAEAGAIVAVPLQAVIQAQSQYTDATFRVTYKGVTLKLPLKALDANELIQTVGNGNVPSSTLILRIDQTNSTAFSSLIGQQGAQQLAVPVTFSVSVTVAGQEKAITSFKSNVEEAIIPSTTAASGVTVVRLDSESGELVYVPSRSGTGTSAASILISTKVPGSVAVIAKTPTVYGDMKSHWAGNDVAQLAAKFIVDGPTATTFNPQKPITRADFAKFIAKGLGLAGNRGNATSKFSDVSTGTNGAAFIGAAVAAGIVQGDANGRFRPNDPITRQEMATMMQRAMTYAGYQPSPSGTELNKFADRAKVSSWAKNAMNACIQAGIISGSTDKKIHPLDNTTRAEAAIMIKRLLQYVNLL